MMDGSESIADRQRRFYSRLRLMTERSESVAGINDASFQRRDGRCSGKAGGRIHDDPDAGPMADRFERVRRRTAAKETDRARFDCRPSRSRKSISDERRH